MKQNTFRCIFYFGISLAISLIASVCVAVRAQSPQGIPYQAVVRNTDGSILATTAVNMMFMIHDGTATGTVVYGESHALTSNAQGLVSCVVGNGVVSQGNFGNIQWGSGAKFLHVKMNIGNGEMDLGTQQMMSVPYALYAGACEISVSEIGDTLYSGNGNFVIVPGISAANYSNNAIPTSGLGAVVLPGNATCADQYINVEGCNGQSSLTYDGRTYDLVEIGGQCWFADNLATDQYRNGDLIPTDLDSASWTSSSIGAYAIYGNNSINDLVYGKLYNWYTVIDERGLCPSGWYIPTDCEWMYLEGSLGMPIQDQELYNYRGSSEGGSLKSTLYWNFPNTGATNSSGFNALPGSYCDIYGKSYNILDFGNWWSSTQGDYSSAWSREIYSNYGGITRGFHDKRNGFSVRCLKDNSQTVIIGCTDASACNFLVNANQDDGSCLYVNATCDDGDANTINDLIDGSCICVGSTVIFGCTVPQSCNFNALANTDDGSCLTTGASCDDGNVNTLNDLINLNCQCAGTNVGNGVFVPGNGVTDIDGNVYTTIVINGQEWMQENLAVSKYRNGDPIPTGLSDATWQSTTSGAYAYYNNSEINKSTYGNLYNWYAVSDNRGICPTGWHVPFTNEWINLETSLGGISSAGGKMKFTSMWNAPNTGATNESGFSGLPSGYRGINGLYDQIGVYGFWWSSTGFNSVSAFCEQLYFNSSSAARFNNGKSLGISVRCIKNI